MRLIPTAAGLLACAAMCLAQTPADPAAQQDPNTFKVDVNLVNIFVSVVDQNGAPVGALGKGDFQLFEDGVKQNIAVFDRHSELPLSIVLAIDTSLSTHKDLQFELQSARAFVRSILRPVDALALYQFSERVDELVKFTSDLKRIDRGIERVRVGAATALYDAIYLASRALEDREGRKVLVLITDGGDTVSSVAYQEAVRAAQHAEAIVYSIIVVPIAASAGRNTAGEHALIQLSADTGGKHYYAESMSQLDQAFRRISDELRTQYLLAYYPSRRVAASDFRRIKVELTTPPDATGPLHARHRSGYYTSKAE
ncbi:MAG TPA: VWA domain-containing protein [Terriglobales bacterium]|nr:VWA domain-containing protein [Terriglobales bacterium]